MSDLLREALDAGADLRREDLDVAVVTCSYDTAFEPVAEQIRGRIAQLDRALGGGWSLWIVDDLPPSEGFGDAVRKATEWDPRVHVVPLSVAPPRGGLKGRAILDGMLAALWGGTPRALAYVNLNLKVDAAFVAPGLSWVLSGEVDAAVGTRAPREGGRAEGRGLLGELKSRTFNGLTRALLPPLRGYRDTNAPVKVFSPEAALALVREARNPNVTMDVEWLLLMHRLGLRVARYPILWRQRAGSRPPWSLVGKSLRDLLRMRGDWQDIVEEDPCSKR